MKLISGLSLETNLSTMSNIYLLYRQLNKKGILGLAECTKSQQNVRI